MQDAAGIKAPKSREEALASLMETVQSPEYVANNIGRIRLATTSEINEALRSVGDETGEILRAYRDNGSIDPFMPLGTVKKLNEQLAGHGLRIGNTEWVIVSTRVQVSAEVPDELVRMREETLRIAESVQSPERKALLRLMAHAPAGVDFDGGDGDVDILFGGVQGGIAKTGENANTWNFRDTDFRIGKRNGVFVFKGKDEDVVRVFDPNQHPEESPVENAELEAALAEIERLKSRVGELEALLETSLAEKEAEIEKTAGFAAQIKELEGLLEAKEAEIKKLNARENPPDLSEELAELQRQLKVKEDALNGAKREVLRTVGRARRYTDLIKALEETGLLEGLEPYAEVRKYLPVKDPRNSDRVPHS